MKLALMRMYEKSNPEKPEFISPQKFIEEMDVPFVGIIKDAGINYKKEEGVLSPKTFFAIVSGGEEREKDYFQMISKKDKFRRVKIEFIADTNQLYPDGLIETALYKQEQYKTSQEDEPDQIFIVSDVDHFYNDLVRIKPKCEKNDIPLIISNSCFEVWLYYGKFNSKPSDFDIPANYLKISQSFKTYLGSKVKGGVNPKYAIFDIFVAIQNAKDNYQEDKNGIPELFSTNMFQLAEELLFFIQDDLLKLIDEKKQRKTTLDILASLAEKDKLFKTEKQTKKRKKWDG